MRRVRRRLPVRRHGVRSRRSPRGQVRSVRGSARTGADTGLRERLPDHRDPLRGTCGPPGGRREGRARRRRARPLPHGAGDGLPAAGAAAERTRGGAEADCADGGPVEPRSARGRAARRALRGGPRRAHGGPDRAGGLQRLLQRLPGEVPHPGRQGRRHHRQRRGPDLPGPDLSEIADDPAALQQRAASDPSVEAGRTEGGGADGADSLDAGAGRDRREARRAARPARPGDAGPVLRYPFRNHHQQRLRAPVPADVGNAQPGEHRAVLLLHQEPRLRDGAGRPRAAQQLHALRHRQRRAVRLFRRQPGGNAPGLFRHDQ